MTQAAYVSLLAHTKQTMALSQVAGLLSWDQEVMMPPRGAAARAEEAAALEAVIHQRRTDTKIGDWLAAIDEAQLDVRGRANLRLARRNYQRSIKVPGKLAEELARTTSAAQGIWAKARKANAYSDFSATLKQIIELKREEADYLKSEGQSRYDALLDDFEPGMRVEVLQPLLEGLRPRLTALRQKIADSGVGQPVLEGEFPEEAQMQLARKLADTVGYDWQAGRLDLSVHPFSSGTGGDSRITTRVDSTEPMGCLYSTLHELGHALYEQGIPEEMAMTPVGHHVSMGVHESQSRLWENQIGRSRAFCQWFHPHFSESFGKDRVQDAETLYRLVNRVETGFIRTESDEVHYNLHVLLRFELERDLIGGTLEVADLEEEWNRRFERDFGITVPDAANGVLQDVHWSVGLFGYFPTYSLGNIYAAQLDEKLRADIGDLDQQISNGDTAAVLAWLRSAVHHQGSLYSPDELMVKASGEQVNGEPLLTYLETKYGEMFNL